jgi:hypothetical protein
MKKKSTFSKLNNQAKSNKMIARNNKTLVYLIFRTSNIQPNRNNTTNNSKRISMAQVHAFDFLVTGSPYPRDRNSSQARRRRRRIHLASRHPARDPSFTSFRRPSWS